MVHVAAEMWSWCTWLPRMGRVTSEGLLPAMAGTNDVEPDDERFGTCGTRGDGPRSHGVWTLPTTWRGHVCGLWISGSRTDVGGETSVTSWDVGYHRTGSSPRTVFGPGYRSIYLSIYIYIYIYLCVKLCSN